MKVIPNHALSLSINKIIKAKYIPNFNLTPRICERFTKILIERSFVILSKKFEI